MVDSPSRRQSSGAHPLRLLRTGGFVPLERLLQPPRPQPHVVLRGALVDELRESTAAPVALVTAGAGSGKSTLLAQWAGEDERGFAWLSAETSMNDPAILVTYLMLALQRLADADPGVLTAIADRSALQTVLLPRLGRMLTGLTSAFVLVVDDAEALTSPEAVAVLSTVVEHLNPGSQLAIAARTPPDLPWSMLRAQRRLVLLGPDELRLTAAETAATLAAAGVDLPPDQVKSVLQRTEGWAAAVYLAAVAMSARSSEGGQDASDAWEGVLADYLREELLADLPHTLRDFLICTSVLTRMCGPLCDAALRRSGSDETLLELESSHLFVEPLDNSRHWFRYHHLFRELLLRELSRRPAHEVAALHERAGRWLAETGDVAAAIPHVQAAGDIDLVATLVWSQVSSSVTSGRAGSISRWLEGLTPDEITGHQKLALAAAWCAMEDGRPVDQWIVAAHHRPADSDNTSSSDGTDPALALLHAQRARDGFAQMRSDAQRALDQLSPADPWRAVGDYLDAVGVLLGGDVDAGRAHLERAAQVATAIETPYIQALCLAQLAALAIESGDWHGASGLSAAAMALLQETGGLEAPSAVVVHCVLTLLEAKDGQTRRARQLTRRAMTLVTALDLSQPWLAAQARYLLARGFLLLGDPAAARVLLSEAQTQLHTLVDAPWLRSRLDAAWTHVESFPLATGVGPSALTSAELRVLQLLPTHLSFEEIGRRLSVSRNTVKTQAIAAYRKLGVSSRTEAVERAASLGMIQT